MERKRILSGKYALKSTSATAEQAVKPLSMARYRNRAFCGL
jgi:hypothetical protein